MSAFDQEVEIELAPHIGIFRNRDVPGMIGRVGTVLGEASINIASMAVSRNPSEGLAVIAITVDQEVPDDVARQVEGLEGFDRVWFIEVDEG